MQFKSPPLVNSGFIVSNTNSGHNNRSHLARPMMELLPMPIDIRSGPDRAQPHNELQPSNATSEVYPNARLEMHKMSRSNSSTESVFSTNNEEKYQQLQL